MNLRAKETWRDMNVNPGDIWIDTKANQMKRRNKANDDWEVICDYPPDTDLKLVIRALDIYLHYLPG